MKPPVARYKTSPISFGDHHNRLDRGDWKDSDSLAGFRTVWSLDLATGFFFEVKISEKTEIDGRPVSVLEFDEPEMRGLTRVLPTGKKRQWLNPIRWAPRQLFLHQMTRFLRQAL
jgi:hypothetical protein